MDNGYRSGHIVQAPAYGSGAINTITSPTGQPKERTSLEALEHDLNNGLDQFWKAIERLAAVNQRLFGPIPKDSQANTAAPLPESVIGRLGDKSQALMTCSHLLHEEISRLERL